MPRYAIIIEHSRPAREVLYVETIEVDADTEHAALERVNDVREYPFADLARVTRVTALGPDDEPLPRESVRAHSDSCCWYCGSSDIEGGNVDIDNRRAYQSVQCNACSSSWTDEYTLSAVQFE